MPPIDKELTDILNYVFRDHIQLWQVQLTHSNVFPLQVHASLKVVISTLAERIKDVDWIPFLTTRYGKERDKITK